MISNPMVNPFIVPTEDNNIIKIIDNNLHQDNKFIDCHIYSMKGTLNYNDLNNNIINLYNKIILDNSS